MWQNIFQCFIKSKTSDHLLHYIYLHIHSTHFVWFIEKNLIFVLNKTLFSCTQEKFFLFFLFLKCFLICVFLKYYEGYKRYDPYGVDKNIEGI